MKNDRILFFLILGVSAVLRFSAITILNIEPTSDYAAYIKMATSMLNTGHMEDNAGNIAFYSSGYPLFLIPFFITFGNSPEVAQFVNATLGVISVLLVYLCSRKVFPNSRWALIPALIWAVYPPAVIYAEYVAKENLMVALLLFQVLLLLNFPKSIHRVKLSALLGITFGIGLLVGPAIILTGMIIGLVVSNLVVTPSLSRFCWNQIFALIIGCAVVLAPWLSYTNHKLGTPILNTNGNFNLYLGNNPNSSVHFIGIQDTPMGQQWHTLRREKGEVEAFSILKKKAIEYIYRNPGKTAWLSLKKVAYFWFPPIHEGKSGDQSTIEKMTRLLWLLSYVAITAATLLIFIFYKKLEYSHLIILSTVILYCIVHAAAYVIFRYRLPVMPFICILAVCGINFLYSWWIERRQPQIKLGLK